MSQQYEDQEEEQEEPQLRRNPAGHEAPHLRLHPDDVKMILAAAKPGQEKIVNKQQPQLARKGFQMQWTFNSSVKEKILLALPETEGEAKQALLQAAQEIDNRNELLTVADANPDVFSFVEEKEKAAKMKSTNPILAEFLEAKAKEDKKDRSKRSEGDRQPFRRPTAAWAPAVGFATSQATYREFEEPRYGHRHASLPGKRTFGYTLGQDQRQPLFANRSGERALDGKKGTCYNCGEAGHWAVDCAKRRK